jgi:hypothetical protein
MISSKVWSYVPSGVLGNSSNVRKDASAEDVVLEKHRTEPTPSQWAMASITESITHIPLAFSESTPTLSSAPSSRLRIGVNIEFGIAERLLLLSFFAVKGDTVEWDFKGSMTALMTSAPLLKHIRKIWKL